MKHVTIDFHFIQDQVQIGALRIAHISSEDQFVDALTKSLTCTRFLSLRVRLDSSDEALKGMIEKIIKISFHLIIHDFLFLLDVNIF